MADIKHEWLDSEHTILLQSIGSLLSEAELSTLIKDVLKILDTANHPVYIIGEADSRLPAPRFAPLRVIENIMRKLLAHRNTSMLFLVGGNAFVRSIGGIVVRYLKVHHRVIFARSRDDALRQIQQHRLDSLA